MTLPNPAMQYCMTLATADIAPCIVEKSMSLGNLILMLHRLNSATAPGEVLRIERYNRALKRFASTLPPLTHHMPNGHVPGSDNTSMPHIPTDHITPAEESLTSS
jgi:hypothetical protein